MFFKLLLLPSPTVRIQQTARLGIDPEYNEREAEIKKRFYHFLSRIRRFHYIPNVFPTWRKKERTCLKTSGDPHSDPFHTLTERMDDFMCANRRGSLQFSPSKSPNVEENKGVSNFLVIFSSSSEEERGMRT